MPPQFPDDDLNILYIEELDREWLFDEWDDVEETEEDDWEDRDDV